MNDKELFIECVNRLGKRGISMDGTLVIFNGEVKFNCEGFNLAFNLMRLGEVIKENVEF